MAERTLLIVSTALGAWTSGCFVVPASSQTPPSFAAWDVEERMTVPAPQTRTDAATVPVEVRPNGAAIATVDERARPQQLLCAGHSACAVTLKRGVNHLGVWSDSPESAPDATFELEVDGPASVELERPATGFAYVGAGLAVVGLVAVVFGGVGKEGDGDEATTDALLYGGLGAMATGFGLGIVYWTNGRGRVHLRPATHSALAVPQAF